MNNQINTIIIPKVLNIILIEFEN